MGKIVERKRDNTGSWVEVGIGKRTVVKREFVRALDLTPMEEYELLVKAGVPVAKVHKVVDYKPPGSKQKEPVIVQQKANNIRPSKLIKYAPEIAKIIHTAAKSHLRLTDFQHFNLGIVDKLEPENRDQKVVVRDISGSVIPPEEGDKRTKSEIVEEALENLVLYVDEDKKVDEWPLADDLKRAVQKHLKLLAKRTKTAK